MNKNKKNRPKTEKKGKPKELMKLYLISKKKICKSS